MNKDITAEINTLEENHGNELIYEVAQKNETAAIVFDSFSDTYKELYGFRPYALRDMIVKNAISGLREMLEEIEVEYKKDLAPIAGVFFNGEPVKPIDW
jgi:hypothetical protein